MKLATLVLVTLPMVNAGCSSNASIAKLPTDGGRPSADTGAFSDDGRPSADSGAVADGGPPRCAEPTVGACKPDADVACFGCETSTGTPVYCYCNAAQNARSDAGPTWMCVGTEEPDPSCPPR